MTAAVNLPRHVALYRDICQHPEDDTRRLAYADVLDELGDERVECPKCNGNRGEYKVPGFTVWGCQACEVTGTVLPTANRDRAEYIRVQCEIETTGRVPRLIHLHHRQTQLEDSHPEWRKRPCPACEGSGYQGLYADSSDPPCQACGGTGDLFARKRWQQEGGGAVQVTGSLLVTFARGFPDSVECTAADVWREGIGASPSGGTAVPVTVPTEWAKAVVQCTPVSRFIITDNLWELVEQMPRGFLSAWASFREPAVAEESAWVALGKWVRAAAYPAVPGG